MGSCSYPVSADHEGEGSEGEEEGDEEDEGEDEGKEWRVVSGGRLVLGGAGVDTKEGPSRPSGDGC